MTGTRLVVLALALGLVLTGCGGSGVEPDVWAEDVCGSVTSFRATVEKTASEDLGDAQNFSDTDKMRDALVEFFRTMEKSFQRLEGDIEAAGVPDVENGEEISKEMVAHLVSARESFAETRKKLAAADVSDPAAAQAMFAELGQDLQRVMQRSQDIADKVKSPELEKAYKATPACEKAGMAS